MTSAWSRRALLATGGGAALALGLPSPASADTSLARATAAFAGSVTADGDDAFAALRAKWRELYLGSGFSPTAEPFRSKLAELGAQAAAHRAAMAPATGSLWPDLVYLDPDPDTDTESFGFSANMNTGYNRLRTMAEAYVQPGTGLTGDTALRDAVVTGLDHLHADVFNPATARYGNWWNWQIGAPQALMDTCVLLHDELTDAQRAAYCAAVDHFLPDSAVGSYTGTSTGANRVDLCRGIILRGIVGANAGKIALAVAALSPVFPYVTKGDGFYPDGSFVQHTNIPYIGGYGAVLNDGLGRLFALLRGSAWEITDPGSRQFLDTIEAAIAPFIHDGLMMDNVSGRGITRVGTSDHTRAHGVMASIVLLGLGAEPGENARWRAMVKGWLVRDRYAPALADGSLSLVNTARLQALLDDASVTAAPEPSAHRVFHHMDRVTHRRRGWGAGLSMASARIAHYEFGNGENKRGWHTGAGWLQWWGSETNQDQYSDAYWPTVDPYRLPGTTVSRKKMADGQGGAWANPVPDTKWVGGTGDGEFGTTGQHLQGLASTMHARKSWFWLDDCVVCLGSGITSADGAAVETVIDNRFLGAGGTRRLLLDGRAQPTDQGWATTRTTKWAHVDGHAGYVFPGGTALHALREERTGTWRDVNDGGTTTPLTRRYLTLWQDHGTDPVNGSYAYVLLPGASAERTAARAADTGWLRILAQDADRTGIQVPSLGFTGVTFWAAGTAGPVTVDAPVCVQIREKRDGTATVCVADPSRTVTGLTLTWRRPVRSVLSRPASVGDVRTGSSLTLTFGDLSASAGATHTVRVRLR
ncbi:polysaccharide lyase 8 family protein [Streptomyces sp. NPDC056347]|uniref:polysaccharide lyase 8 family protein n=1 Tax=Streptomyces sp. NPDC056347 TaxID=3345790 RepID=UPI0035DB16BD